MPDHIITGKPTSSQLTARLPRQLKLLRIRLDQYLVSVLKLMHLYRVMPFEASGQLRLDQSDPDHCSGPAMYWR